MSRRSPSTKPRPRLALDQLVQAAIDLLDDVGLDGLTTRGVAARLGVQSPALYWHVRDKNELLDLVADAICVPALDAVTAVSATLAWREQAVAGLRAYRAVLRSHRDAPRLLAERPPVGPIRRRIADAAVGVVLRAGFPEADAAVISLLLGDYVISIVSEEMRIEAQAGAIDRDEASTDASHEYPNLTRLGPHLAAVQPDALFETGLEILLDGIDQRLQRLKAASAATIESASVRAEEVVPAPER